MLLNTYRMFVQKKDGFDVLGYKKMKSTTKVGKEFPLNLYFQDVSHFKLIPFDNKGEVHTVKFIFDKEVIFRKMAKICENFKSQKQKNPLTVQKID